MSAATLAPVPLRDGGRELTRPPSLWRTGARLPEVRWAAAALALFLTGWALQIAGAPSWTWWAAYLTCYAAGGWEPALAGLQALRDKTLDVDLLMIVAAIAAASIGQVFDGALLIVIFATSGSLEAIVTQRTADSVAALLNLAPEQATVLTPDGEEVVAVSDLAVGQVVLVRPGEIGADGTSEVDQQAITGESVPVVRSAGDTVLSGTVNGTGSLQIRVDKPASESVVARIVSLTEEASATKARSQLFIEKVEQRYSLGVVVATLVVFGLPLALGATFDSALLRAITFMIVASPCAVVLSTMPPLLAAIANAGRHGVLVKSATVMETIGRTDVVAFDKTGTLTEGAPVVHEVTVDAGAGMTPDAVLALAAAVEQYSEHPLGRAIVREARDRGVGVAEARDFRAVPGRGVVGVVDGIPVAVERGAEPATVGTVVAVLAGGREVGAITLLDRLRPDAPAAVAALAAETGAQVHLLTGDNQRTADDVAARTGIDVVHAELLPEDKSRIVGELQDDGRHVLLVGDGVNDAPALARAGTGIAMGRHGSDVALDTADAIVVRDELAAIPNLVRMSRKAHRYVVANLTIAATFITVLVAWDLIGSLPLPLAVAGHEGSTVIVALNGLRLLRDRAWTR